MAQLRQDYAEFTARGAAIVVVGPEDADAFREYWTKEALPFVGLPDPTHKVAEMYGQEIKLLKFGRMPAMLIIDKAGDIRCRHYGNQMSDIPADAEVLALLDKIDATDQN
jgi:peroxiredoxin